jgi:hypothetical protein
MEAAYTLKTLLLTYKIDGVITQNIKNQLTTVTTLHESHWCGKKCYKLRVICGCRRSLCMMEDIFT